MASTFCLTGRIVQKDLLRPKSNGKKSPYKTINLHDLTCLGKLTWSWAIN